MHVLDFRKVKLEGSKVSMVTCYDYASERAAQIQTRLHSGGRQLGYARARHPTAQCYVIHDAYARRDGGKVGSRTVPSKAAVVPTKALAWFDLVGKSGACFCATRFAARTARSIGPGRS
jgi:hypothetical protein